MTRFMTSFFFFFLLLSSSFFFFLLLSSSFFFFLLLSSSVCSPLHVFRRSDDAPEPRDLYNGISIIFGAISPLLAACFANAASLRAPAQSRHGTCTDTAHTAQLQPMHSTYTARSRFPPSLFAQEVHDARERGRWGAAPYMTHLYCRNWGFRPRCKEGFCRRGEGAIAWLPL